MRNRILTATISAVSITTLAVTGVVPAALAESPAEENEPGIIRVVPVETTPTTITVFPGVIGTPTTQPPPPPVDPGVNPALPAGDGELITPTTRPDDPFPPADPGGGVERPDLEWCFDLDNDCPPPEDEIDDLKDPSSVDPGEGGEDEGEGEGENPEPDPGPGEGENPDPGSGGGEPDPTEPEPGSGGGEPDPTEPEPGLPADLDEPIPGNPKFTG